MRVGVSAQLTDPHGLIDQTLTKLDALGPDFTHVNAGNFDAIRIEREPNPVTIPSEPCQRGVTYAIETRTIYIDQACLASPNSYHEVITSSLAQLIGRIVGMQTICRADQTDPNCSEVGKGRALMNSHPTTNLPTTGTFETLFTVSQPIFTDLDLAEYRLHGHRL